MSNSNWSLPLIWFDWFDVLNWQGPSKEIKPFWNQFDFYPANQFKLIKQIGLVDLLLWNRTNGSLGRVTCWIEMIFYCESVGHDPEEEFVLLDRHDFMWISLTWSWGKFSPVWSFDRLISSCESVYLILRRSSICWIEVI